MNHFPVLIKLVDGKVVDVKSEYFYYDDFNYAHKIVINKSKIKKEYKAALHPNTPMHLLRIVQNIIDSHVITIGNDAYFSEPFTFTHNHKNKCFRFDMAFDIVQLAGKGQVNKSSYFKIAKTDIKKYKLYEISDKVFDNLGYVNYQPKSIPVTFTSNALKDCVAKPEVEMALKSYVEQVNKHLVTDKVTIRDTNEVVLNVKYMNGVVAVSTANELFMLDYIQSLRYLIKITKEIIL